MTIMQQYNKLNKYMDPKELECGIALLQVGDEIMSMIGTRETIVQIFPEYIVTAILSCKTGRWKVLKSDIIYDCNINSYIYTDFEHINFI